MTNEPVVLADIVHTGSKLIVPETLTLNQAVSVLMREIKAQSMYAEYSAEFDATPWDGAIVLTKVLNDLYGYSQMMASGRNRPSMITIATGLDTSVTVPWGMIDMPQWYDSREDDPSFLVTDVKMQADGTVGFALSTAIRKRYEPLWLQLVEAVKAELRRTSIYRGKAIRVRFRDTRNGEMLPFPDARFVDLSNGDPVIFDGDVEAAIQANLFNPVMYTEQVRAAGIPLKRGVLLAGPYGTGKTLAARTMARLATANGWTFVYVDQSMEVPDAIRFALRYQPSVVFAEDIDHVVGGERTLATDSVLNVIDGIDTKSSELMVVLTTNDVESIEPALLRPGRLDAVLHLGPPKKDAVERLIRHYAGSTLVDPENLSVASEALAGQIPAVIRECVERARLYAIGRHNGQGQLQITSEDVYHAARTMQMHWELLTPPVKDARSSMERAADILGQHVAGALLTNGEPMSVPNGVAIGRTK